MAGDLTRGRFTGKQGPPDAESMEWTTGENSSSMTATGGTCTSGCHQQLSYDRQNAVEMPGPLRLRTMPATAPATPKQSTEPATRPAPLAAPEAKAPDTGPSRLKRKE